jgi:hypothetical protein
MEYEYMIGSARPKAKEMELWAEDTKRITAKVIFMTNTGSHVGFIAKYVPEAIEEGLSHQVTDPHKAGTGGLQYQLGITGPEAVVESWKKGTYGKSQMIRDSVQYVRHQDALEAMAKFSLYQMTESRKARKGGHEDQLRTTGPEAMVEYLKKGTYGQPKMIIDSVQYVRHQDVPEAMETLLSHQVMDYPKAVKGGLQEHRCITGPDATVELWKKGTHGQYQMMSHSAQDGRTQEAPEVMEEIETVDLTSSPIAEELYPPQQTNVPREATGGTQEQLYKTVLEALVKFGKQNMPPQSRAVSIYVQDSKNQDAPEATPKIYGRTITAEPFCTMSHNEAAKIGGHEIITREDSYDIIQQEVR